MSGDNIMEWAGLWDESEFNFFKTLEDEDKLMYIYDLCLGEFGEDFIFEQDEDEIHSAMEQALRSMGESLEDADDEPSESFRNEIKVLIDTEVLTIEGPTLDVILKVANDMQLNGLILMDRNVTFTKFEPWNVILTYKIIGNGPPFSVN
tara:strand:+ start:16 stop:462 length:447 start_codon:yes stop_codon:yes gene_type:complete